LIKKQRTAIGNLLITELQLEGARERALARFAANPEKHPRLRLMLAEVPEVMQCCEEHEERGEHLITDLRRNRENRRNN